MNISRTLASFLLLTAFAAAGREVKVEKISGRTLAVTCQENGQTYSGRFDFPIGPVLKVNDEYHKAVKLFNAKHSPWAITIPHKLRSMECNTPYSYLLGTMVVKSSKEPDAVIYQQGKDFEIRNDQGVFGRLPDGAIKENTPVYISYEYINQRIDAIVLRDGKLQLVNGTAKVNCPQLPELQKNDKLLLTVWVYGSGKNLPDNSVMIIDEAQLKLPDVSDTAERLLPKTMEKLRQGRKVRILAWGDSITNGGYLPVEKRWTTVFINELRSRYPQAEIEFFIVGWGGRNTSNYFMHSACTEYDYQKKVLDIKPDLIISEFMNDCNLPPVMYESNYPRILSDFRKIGAEWVAMTPCYSLYCEDSPQDSRRYVSYLRQFCADNNIALADASVVYGKLRYAGIPYMTTLLNSVNHPDALGMKILADSVLALFPAEKQQ